jgi:hypothetical protein
MIFFLTLFIIFIKFFIKILIGLFVFTDVLIKLIGLCILISLLHYIYTYPIRQRRKLSTLRALRNKFPDKYIIKTYKDYIWNTFILIIYPLIFIVGILWLRFRNTERAIDLLYYYYEFKQIFALTSISNIILNLLLFICFIVLYIKLLSLLSKYVKFQLIKRHLRNSGYDFYNYDMYVFITDYVIINNVYHFLSKNISLLFHYLGLKQYPENIRDDVDSKHFNDKQLFELQIVLYKYKRSLEKQIDQFLLFLLSKRNYLHQSILIMVIIYDIIFNHFILTHMFIILPYIFLYDIWVKFSKFISGLNTMADNILAYFLYGDLKQIGPKDFQIGPHPMDIETLRNLFRNYVYTDLVYDQEKIDKANNKKLCKEIGEVPEVLQPTIGLYEIGLILAVVINILFTMVLVVTYINLNNFA